MNLYTKYYKLILNLFTVINSISHSNKEDSCSVCIILKSLLSSANKNKFEYSTTSISVLIQTTNRIGPKTDPCGTSLITSCYDDGVPLTITLCFLLVRKSTILLKIQ